MAVQQQAPTPSLPPQDLDAEESVLGAMLVSPNAIAIVSEVLRPEDFYRGSHQRLYETMLAMYGEGETIDSITVINALQSRGLLDQVGGKPVVHTLASTVSSVANAQRYAQIVRDASTFRNLISAGTEIARIGYERLGEPQEVVDQAEQIVFSIADQRISHDFRPVSDLLTESFERITQLHQSEHDLTGVASGYRDLDEHHLRLPTLEPADPGRPPQHGEDLAGAEHGRSHRNPRAGAGRGVLAGDVERGGDPAADVRRGPG